MINILVVISRNAFGVRSNKFCSRNGKKSRVEYSRSSDKLVIWCLCEHVFVWCRMAKLVRVKLLDSFGVASEVARWALMIDTALYRASQMCSTVFRCVVYFGQMNDRVSFVCALVWNTYWDLNY